MTIQPKSYALSEVTTTIRPTTDRPSCSVAKVAPEFTTIRSTPFKPPQNLYSHNSAKNTTTIRPVTTCCKDKNQTILGDSLGRQGGRRALHDGYAPVSFLMRRGRRRSRMGERQQKIDGITIQGCQTNLCLLAVSHRPSNIQEMLPYPESE
jgi:hypothetical protein